MKSIMQSEKECYLCGRNGTSDPLDSHHIFNGYGLREKSEEYGLKVYLCHFNCHIYGDYAAHRSRATADFLKAEGQRAFMKEYGKTKEEFISIFGRNYINE